MKCCSCGSTINEGSKLCNECGVIQSQTKKEQGTFDNVAGVLLYTANTYCYDILLVGNLFAYICDIAPSVANNEKKLVKLVYDFGAADVLRKAIRMTDMDKNNAIKRAISLMTNMYIEKDAVEWIIYNFAAAINWSVTPIDDKM